MVGRSFKALAPVALAALAALLLFSLGEAPQPAGACSFERTGPTPSTQDYVSAASLVVEGRVLEVMTDEHPYSARIEVVAYLKGGGPGEIVIQGFGTGAGDCLEPAFEGQHAIFYAAGAPNQQLKAVWLDVYQASDPIEPTLVARIREAAGQEPAPPQRPTAGQTQQAEGRTGVNPYLVALAMLLVLAASAWQRHRARTRRER